MADVAGDLRRRAARGLATAAASERAGKTESICLRAAVWIAPNDVDTWRRILRAGRRSRQFGISVVAASQLLRLLPEDEDACHELTARAGDKTSTGSRALERLRELVAARSETTVTREALARALAARGLHHEALEHYVRLADQAPGKFLREAAKVALEVEDWETASRCLESLVARGRPDPTALRWLAQSHERAGQPIKAADAWQRVGKLQQDPELLERAAKLYLSGQGHDAAVAVCGHLLRTWPDRTPALILAATAHRLVEDWPATADALLELERRQTSTRVQQRQLAEALARSQRVEEAISHWQQVARHAPHDPEPWRWLARLWLDQGDSEAAGEALEQLVERDPSDVGSLRRVVKLRRQAGDHAQALRFVRRLLELLPEDPAGLFWLASSLEASGLHAEAAATYGKIARRSPENTRALFSLLRAAGAAGSLETALDQLWRHLTSGGSTEYLEQAIRQLRRLDGTDALAAFATARASSGLATDALLAARCQLDLGNLEPARRALETVRSWLASEPPAVATANATTLGPAHDLARGAAELRAMTFEPVVATAAIANEVDASGKPRRTLVFVEDEASCDLLAEQLPEGNVTVIVERDGSAAQRALAATRPDAHVLSVEDFFPEADSQADANIIRCAAEIAESSTAAFADAVGGARDSFPREAVALFLEDELARRIRTLVGFRAAAMQEPHATLYVLLEKGYLLPTVVQSLNDRETGVFVACGSHDPRTRLRLAMATSVDELRPPRLRRPTTDPTTSLRDFLDRVDQPLLANARSGHALLAMDLRDPNYRRVALEIARHMHEVRPVALLHFGRLATGRSAVTRGLKELENAGQSIALETIPRGFDWRRGNTKWTASVCATAISRAEASGAIEFGGLHLTDLVQHVLAAFFRSQAPALLDLHRRAAELVARARPACVMASPGWMPEARIIVAAARSVGVPTIDVQTLLVRRIPRYKPPAAQYSFVIDDNQAEIYRDYLGVPADRITPVGYLGLDAVARRLNASTNDELRRNLGLADPSHRIVTIATQPEQIDKFLRIAETVLEAIAGEAGVTTVIKLHPREDDARLETFRRLAQRVGAASCRVVREVDIHELLAVSELVLTSFSNVGIEAALLGKNVVAAQLDDETPEIDLARMGVALRASSPHELRALVGALLSDPETRRRAAERRSKYLEQRPYMRPGHAARSAVEAAERFAAAACD